MVCKRKRQRCKQPSTGLAVGKVQTEQMKGRDKTMLQKKTENWQEVNGE